MLDTPLEAISTTSQFTGLGVFYTYFLAFTLAFHLPVVRAIYSAALGALLVYFTGIYQFDNMRFEPKTIVVYGLFMQSFCSASLAACLFAEKKLEDAWILIILPKVSIVLFFISFYLTRCASMFYVRILGKSGKYSENVSFLSWIVTIILMGFRIVGYEDYAKSLGVTMIAFGFLYLSLAFFINDKLPEAYGLFPHEISKLFGFYALKGLIRYEEHRTFTCSEGITFFFRNLTNEKVAVDISFSNPEDHLTIDNFSRKYIRGRGHLKIEVKRGETRKSTDRFFVFYAKSIEDLDNSNNSGFLTVNFDT